jgi:uncharacterized protein (DUF305 family)
VTAALGAAGLAAPAPATAAQTPGALYAASCKNQSRQPSPGSRATPYGACVSAMRRLAQARSRSPLIACAALSRKRIAGTQASAFSRCVAAGRALTRRGNGIDLAYVEQMIPHHVGAVEMAQYGLEHGESEYIRTLSASIIRSQNVEIATMRGLAARLRAAGIRPVALGLSTAQMGMDHHTSHLVGASPFDVVFVDMMIPHHEGALTMSNVLYARGTGTRTRALAEQITSSQTLEIQQMRQFRLQLTGSPAPAPDDGPHDHPH